MVNSPDSFIVTGFANQQVSAGNILITPDGGTQATLGSLLAAAGDSDVTTMYITSGAVKLTDSVSMINAAEPGTWTVANGSTKVIPLNIGNIGAQATISFTSLENGGEGTVTLAAGPSGANLVVRWLPSLATWKIQ